MFHTGFDTAADALKFIISGSALFTITSRRTGKHFTFKASSPKSRDGAPRPPIFVKVLTGPDNGWNGDWTFLGSLFRATDDSVILHLVAGRKGRRDLKAFAALEWALQHLKADELPETLAVQHEGKCGVCSRSLTHPNSIASGIGPECAKKGGL